VTVAVNGREVGGVPARERWTRARLRIPRAPLRPGLNRLTLRWPALPPAGSDPLRPVRERLESGLAADLHPVFGEVWSVVGKPLKRGRQKKLAGRVKKNGAAATN
jgi:cation diffusion facilitator CzcD-associated flavoprotein CzcO